MTDTTTPTTVIPSLWQRLISAYATKAVDWVAAALVTIGALHQTDETQFVTIGVGIIVWAANGAYAYLHAHAADLRLRKAVIAPSSTPVTK